MQVKKKSQKQESSVARDLGGKTVVASGAKWFADSDVRTDKFLVECKTTSKNYFSVTTSLWEKIEREALKDHARIPMMVIDLNHDNMVGGSRRYVVFRANAFDGIPQPYDCTFNGEDGVDNKSFRVYYNMLTDLSDDDTVVRGKLFNIKAVNSPNKVRHNLFVTTMGYFKEYCLKEYCLKEK